ncbi:MAG: GNAT family N-acetyltransferase [Hyphomicrobiaceae bacterium]
MSGQVDIRQMSRTEVDVLVGWAAEEGWNPGLHDADAFWANDSKAFIAAEHANKLIGGGAITSYDGEFGFMGFFIVNPEFRGRGLGDELWHARRERLLARLRPGASIGLDGVFEMQSYYAKGGFAFSHRDIRYRAEIMERPTIPEQRSSRVVPAHEVPFNQLAEYDRLCFPAPRATFLRQWLSQPNGRALAYLRDGKLSGYGVVRRCQNGCKIGPLFSDDFGVAKTLYAHLSEYAVGGPLFLDVPENNPAAAQLVQNYRMVEVFGCARMYLGPIPALEHHRIFGVTTFELG